VYIYLWWNEIVAFSEIMSAQALVASIGGSAKKGLSLPLAIVVFMKNSLD
jgi:hypothetical protein